MVIGKIPAYNDNITRNGNGINYRDHLLNNLTIAEFTPIGYSINLAGGNSLYKLSSNISTVDSANNKLGNETTNKYISTYTALKQWQDMQKFAGEEIRDTFKILCTNDSTFNETLSNRYDRNWLDTMADNFKNTSFGKAGGWTERFANSLDTGSALAVLNSMNKVSSEIGGSGFAGSVNSFTKDYGVDMGFTGQALNLLFGKLIGIQSALPKIWSSSDYNNTSSFTIKLVSPSGHPDDVDAFVIKPLKHLILAASPITFDGIMYGYPPLWKVEAKGLATMKLAAITTLSISRGGQDTVFNRYNQPTNIDVRIVVEPVIDGFATPILDGLDDTVNTPASDGSVKMLVQNPNSITKPMLNKTIYDSAIELKPLSLS